MSIVPALTLTPLPGIPLIQQGDDLAAILDRAAQTADTRLSRGALIVCQKIVSKAEGEVIPLRNVTPSAQARQLANELDKDPRHIEVVLSESTRIVRQGPDVLICETRHGFVCANAGVDFSNAPALAEGEEVAVLLPADCDASARRLKEMLEMLGHGPLGVLISDTFGRPWREALVDVALGSAGISPVVDWRGECDLSGRPLRVTAMALADQLCAAAGMLMGKNAGIPAVWIEGCDLASALLDPFEQDEGVASLIRPAEKDLFR